MATVEEAISSYAQQGRYIGQSAVLGLHQTLFENIPEDPRHPIRPGRLRSMTERVVAQGAEHLNQHMMDPVALPGAFVDLLERAEHKRLPNLTGGFSEQAARFHYRFVHMHPFCDGNGRMARSVSLWLLAREDIYILTHSKPINTILWEHKVDYLAVLAHCDRIYAELTECGFNRDEALLWGELPFVYFLACALILSYAEENVVLRRYRGEAQRYTPQDLQRVRKNVAFSNIENSYPADKVVQVALSFV